MNRAILQSLRDTGEFVDLENFRVYFRSRDPWPGCGWGLHGVTGLSLINSYAEGLERAFRMLQQERKATPKTPIPVYVMHIPGLGTPRDIQFENGWPFTYSDSAGVFIVLPSRSKEPHLHSLYENAMTQAAHEVAHAFNFVSPQPEDKHWRMFDEATAVFMERRVFPGTKATLGFCSDWMDLPERSLLTNHTKHQSWMFLEYLSRRHGPNFISTVWNDACEGELPLQTIARLATTSLPNLFLSYCADSYFTSDPNSHMFCPDAHIRYGTRAITYSARLSPSETPFAHTGSLDHLSCRYYRFGVAEAFASVRITLTPAPNRTPLLAAAASVCRCDMRRGMHVPLTAGPSGLSACLGAEHLGHSDHIAVTIVNSGTEPATERSIRDDYYGYTLEARAL